ncbi:MAG: FadR family transcriptional regulator [Spirochaetaceae bacterium]|nr:MAG: FadR family transcriptional regulator [Spirochaetaceae bacterium]
MPTNDRSDAVRPDHQDRTPREHKYRQVAARLTDQIFDGAYPPGTALPPTQQLSEEFGVGLSTVREAIRELRAVGMVEIVPGTGAIVRRKHDELLRVFFRRVLGPDFQAYRDFMDVRRLLECEAAALTARHASDADIESLKSIVERMGSYRSNPHLYARANAEFHLEISRLSQNDLIHYLIKSVRDSVHYVIERTVGRVPAMTFEDIHQVHIDIFDGIARRDPKRAADAMHRHFSLVIDWVDKNLAETDRAKPRERNA